MWNFDPDAPVDIHGIGDEAWNDGEPWWEAWQEPPPPNPSQRKNVKSLADEARETRLQMESVVSQWHLDFGRTEDDKTKLAQFPNLFRVYWYHAGNHAFPLFPGPFIQEVVDRVQTKYPWLHTIDIRARACVFLASMIRRHHFALLLQEQYDMAIWSERLEDWGIDILLIDRGRPLGIRLSTNTDHTQHWEDDERQRYALPDSIPIYPIKARAEEFVPGRVWLHNDVDLEDLFLFINVTDPWTPFA